jgi:hypothetical protein
MHSSGALPSRTRQAWPSDIIGKIFNQCAEELPGFAAMNGLTRAIRMAVARIDDSGATNGKEGPFRVPRLLAIVCAI